MHRRANASTNNENVKNQTLKQSQTIRKRIIKVKVPKSTARRALQS